MLANLEKSGKTIFLLKQKSKPQMGTRSRRKIDVLGSIHQYKESKKKPQILQNQNNAQKLADAMKNKKDSQMDQK